MNCDAALLPVLDIAFSRTMGRRCLEAQRQALSSVCFVKAAAYLTRFIALAHDSLVSFLTPIQKVFAPNVTAAEIGFERCIFDVWAEMFLNLLSSDQPKVA